MVKIWIELEMRLSVSPWLGLLCTHTAYQMRLVFLSSADSLQLST